MKPDILKIRSARSKQDFPDVDLDEGEFVELAVNRSKIGLVLIWIVAIAAAALLLVAGILLLVSEASSTFNLNGSAKLYLGIGIVTIFAVIFIIGMVGAYVYKNNHLIITNKRAIQQSTTSLFSRSTNIIDLQSIEDVSFQQAGIFQYLFHLGTIRMATVGDETTYTFPYVDTPRDEIKVITRLVHEAKERLQKS